MSWSLGNFWCFMTVSLQFMSSLVYLVQWQGKNCFFVCVIMATNFLELATTLKDLGAKWLPEKKVNFMPCIQWLVHGPMTSYNETVYRQVQWVGNTAKKNYDVKWETVLWNVARCRMWSEHAVEGGLMLSLESECVFQKVLLFCFAINQIT